MARLAVCTMLLFGDAIDAFVVLLFTGMARSHSKASGLLHLVGAGHAREAFVRGGAKSSRMNSALQGRAQAAIFHRRTSSP